MSETRPPITAGPIERALRFLKSTSLRCGEPEDGAGVTEADNAGALFSGEAAGRDPAPPGKDAGGDSSCPNAIETNNRPDTTRSRVLIGVKDKSWRFALERQAHRCFCATEIAVIVDLI